MLLFKYLSPDAVPHVFEAAEEVTLKFGVPADFNDPYELFLQTNRPLASDEQMAFYEYFCRGLPQLPVTCFSHYPHSIPMWAHYAREGAGICIGFDEDALVQSFPAVYISDVMYSDRPAEISASAVEYAFATAKRRHTIRLISLANRAVYFTKRLEWGYEGERRLVVDQEAVIERNGSYFGRVPTLAVRSIIVGHKIDKELGTFCQTQSAARGIPLLNFCVGRRSYEPFFAQGDQCLRWNGAAFDGNGNLCPGCGDPSQAALGKLCRWCNIDTEAHETARRRSQLSFTLHYGIDKGIPMYFDDLKPRGQAVNQGEDDPTRAPTHDGAAEFEF